MIITLNENFIGMIYLKNINWISRNCYFTIFIGEKVERGKNIGQQAMELTHEYVFNYLNMRKITLEVVKFNNSAIKLYQKMGYKEEGILKEHFFFNNSFHDVCIFSIINNTTVK
ncbi:MAG: hypothetical protein A2W98_01220 [Bacteroidetes bacterium GWF2_33_38]|nr:MAG: hypothetical protein A2W98_01220 [Bacteroidetes bacterium GWF2_33_38]OFY73582.1 MAG: hypothetical protein A2265_02480 [Bacteroidetes bacterium RIFOXYA12_FULL_33_9]HBX50585.1 hypothetical protein [Bacteroidales bacterium]